MDNSTYQKKHHSPFLLLQSNKSTEKTQLYQFKSKLLFENLMHISPQEIEESLNITDPNLKLPSYLELLDLKIRIQTEEQKLKEILPQGLHSGQAWLISKYLSFLYLICANIFLTRNIYQKFSLFYMKALHVIEPPTQDCDWESKAEWQILRIIAGTHLSLFYCKNEKLDKSIEILQNLKLLLHRIEHYSSASKILYHIYASLGLLFYRMEEFSYTRRYLEKGIIHLEKSINKPEPKKPNNKEMQEQYEDEIKNLEYCKLINLYLNYKLCKISFMLDDKEASFEWLTKAQSLLYNQGKLQFIENKDSIMQYIEIKLIAVQKKLQIDLKKNILIDLERKITESSDSFISELKEIEEKNLEVNKKEIYKIAEPNNKQETPLKNKKTKVELQKDEILYRIRKTKSNFFSAKIISEPIQTKKDEVTELKKLRSVKSSQIKSAYRHYDFRPCPGHMKSQSSNFTMIQKNQEKYAKVYEMLGRPVFIYHKKQSSLKSNFSLSTNNSASNLIKIKEDSKKAKTNINEDLWKKIQEFNSEFEPNNKETSEKKPIKEIKEMLILKEDESMFLQKLSHPNKDKIKRMTNIFLNIKNKNFKTQQMNTPKNNDPIIDQLVFDLKELNEDCQYFPKPEQRKNLKKNEEIVDEAIRNFFSSAEGKNLISDKNDLESLNTIKSSGDFEDEIKSGLNMKESIKFELSSSKVRNESDKMTPNLKEPNSTYFFKSMKNYKFDVPNNEINQKAASLIQKKFRIYLKSKRKIKKSVESLIRNPSPSFQRAFKKYHTMTNLHLKPTLVKNEEPIVIHENKVKPMKRHRSFINNMKDLLMKRRQIKIIINKNFFMDKNHKLKPKIMVYDMSTSISNYMKKSDGRMANTGLVRNKKQDLTITELEDKSMEIMEVLSQLDMDQQPKVDTLSFLKEKEGGSHSETPSISEFKESLKEIEEMDVRKTKLNILTPMKLKIGIKRFQHQIIENKKKEIKSDFNHLIYTPFFFTRFFDGKLRKWRVKYCNIKGKEQDRRVIFSLQTKHWNYDFECPILKEPIGKAFRDYRTTWPITFQAFYDWMIAKNFINEEDFKNEHKYMSEKMKAKMAFFDWKLHSAKQSLTSITPMDVKACGDIKILLEILLENYFIYTLKMNGEALKFIGFDSKESVINSYAHIIFDLRRMRQELRRMKFMGIYYEQKQKKCLMDDFKKSTNLQKYSKLYSPEFLNNLKMIFSNPKFQQLVQRDLDSQSTLLKKYKNLKVSYHKELVLLMHRRLRSRFVITQFIKKDLFNNLFWIVLVSVSAAMNRSYDTYKLSNSFDLTFVIKIFNNRYQKSHMNQETLNLRNFERQLQMRLKMTKLIKNLLITGHLPVPMKKILKESLSNDLNIIDSKIRLKHHGELSSINEQEFFQQNVEKKFNKINKNTLLFTKRKAVITDPINELFENTFVEIYNKDFTQKREENFDTFYENEEKVDNDLDEEIQDLKNKIKYPTKYGHLEVIQEEDVEFIQNREVLNVNSETLEHSEKENLNFPSSISVNMTYYLKIRLNPGLNILFLRIIIVPMLDTTILHFSIYAPWNRFITYGRIEDKKMIIILMRILKMKNIKLKKVKLANILQFQSRVHGFSYMFLNKKKEKEFGASKKTLIFSSDISMRSHLIKNSEELQMKFQHKTLHFLIKLPKIGKANVTMNVYSCENLLEAFQENSLLICFQINYYYSRTKALKLILNRDDLSEIFKMETGKPMTTAIFLNKVRELLKQISFIRQKLYSSPQFIPKFEVPRLDLSSSPLIKKHSGNRQHVDLEMLRWHKNNFTKHDLGKTQTNLTKGYLEQYIKDTRIIGQFIKKIRSDFILVTVCKHMILDYWVLYSYVPKNSRYYVCYITNSDLLYMDIKDLSDIYPAQIYEQCISTSTKRAFTNYRSFFKKYKGGVEDNSDGDNNVKERKTGFQLSQLAKYQSEENNESSKKEIGHIVNSFKNKKMRKVMKIKKITDLTEKMSFAARKSLPHVRYHNLYNFIEFYIWENFIKKIDLKSLEDNSWFFTLRKFKVHLKQVLYTNYVKIDKYNDAQIEIFILLNREKERETVIKDEKETNQEKESEKENNIKNRESKFKEKYNEKLRRKVKDRINENHKSENEIDFGLKNVEIKNQTTNFNSKEKESLFSPFEPIGYAATSNHNILIRYLSLNKLSIQFEKINLREIINLFIADGFHKFQTNYMNSKFYLSDLQNLCNFIIYKIKSSNFANLIHDNSSKKKHHASKNTQYFNRMVETEDGSEIPIIQQIFNRKPLQIINFRFHLEEKLLSAVIYKKTSCQSITREYKFEALKDVIFFFDEMLKNQLYKEICNRLLKVIGNILSIDVNFEFMLLDKNDD